MDDRTEGDLLTHAATAPAKEDVEYLDLVAYRRYGYSGLVLDFRRWQRHVRPSAWASLTLAASESQAALRDPHIVRGWVGVVRYLDFRLFVCLASREHSDRASPNQAASCKAGTSSLASGPSSSLNFRRTLVAIPHGSDQILSPDRHRSERRASCYPMGRCTCYQCCRQTTLGVNRSRRTARRTIADDSGRGAGVRISSEGAPRCATRRAVRCRVRRSWVEDAIIVLWGARESDVQSCASVPPESLLIISLVCDNRALMLSAVAAESV